MQLNTMNERDDFVVSTVTDKDRTGNVLDIVNVRKLVSNHCESKIEDHPIN
jgi:hypothetical protein